MSEEYEIVIPYKQRKTAYTNAAWLIGKGFPDAYVRKVNPDAHPE